MNFDVVVDGALFSLAAVPNANVAPIYPGKRLLVLANDFENEQWRLSRFLDFVWDNVAETSLSARERASLPDHAMTKLRRSAMNLRLTDKEQDLGRGSEIAEIALYAVMKHHYKALPVVPKIFYKQNKNDNAKGADSVHVVLAQKDKDFTLWLGESKFYSDISDSRLEKIVSSISDLLNTEKIKKENSIIVGLSDLEDLVEDKSLLEKIRSTLNADRSIDKIKSRLHVPILLLYECEITAKAKIMSESYIKQVKEYTHDRAEKYFSKQELKLSKIPGYSEINFHLIVFPVPDKSKIVNDFISIAKILQGSYT